MRVPFQSYESAFTSYAQAREDVVLVRALRDVPAETGFYIDVGVYHPELDSVTKAFYDAGWRGINIESSPDLFPLIERERPRDINLQVAASAKRGELTFFRNGGEQLGTLEQRFAGSGQQSSAQTVQTVPLTEICEQHAPADIHFLKIDVEGHEKAVLEGMDFKRFRPWILVIEAVEPNTHTPTYEAWEHLVLGSEYEFVLADAINRFYVAREKMELAPHFAFVADNYEKNPRLADLHLALSRVSQLETELVEFRRRSGRLEEAEAELAALRTGFKPRIMRVLSALARRLRPLASRRG